MGDSRPRMVFVGHDASRTGAPLVGLAFLRWLAAQDRCDLSIVLLDDGPLVDDHAALAPTTVRRRNPVTDQLDGRGRLPHLPRIGSRARRPDLVVANTLAALGAGAALRPDRLVCWVHELDGVADSVLPPARRGLLDRVDRFVAAGPRVRDLLAGRLGVDAARIATVEPFVTELPRFRPPPSDDAGPRPGERLRILGAGSLVARKGVDSFVAVLAALSTTRAVPPAAWVGGTAEGPVAAEVRADLVASGLDTTVELVPSVPDLGPWWPAEGILLHVPREDPFPLVVVEAAHRAVPVVTWDTGGAADLVRRAGLDDLVAPAGDLLGASRRVAHLLDHPAERLRAGAALSAAASSLVAARQAPRVWAACTGAAR